MGETMSCSSEDAPYAERAARIQVKLAEKRTSLAVLRTGIAVSVIPLSITTVLVALSQWYSWVENLHFLVPMYAILTGLMLLSVWLIVRSIRRIRQCDAEIVLLQK